MEIAVIGTGYVGLVAGAGFAEFGNKVTCVDIDEGRIAALREGQIPIYEPGLDSLVHRNTKRGRLLFTTDVKDAIPNAQVIFIAVGTPSKSDGSANLDYVVKAASEMAPLLSDGAVVVNKSTVPVGTAELVRKTIAPLTKATFYVASNPEFLKEGDAINDFMKPDRVILGTDDPKAEEILTELYEPFFLRTRSRVYGMDIASAELTKYAANAMLATRISFMNELSQLAEAVGADIDKVRFGIGSDPRIGSSFLFPGPGFGGACFPKDTRALVDTGKRYDVPLQVVSATISANERQKQILGQRIKDYFKDGLAGKHIVIWGLAFKAQTDDVRESSALVLAEMLVAAGAKVTAYDPEAMDNARRELGDRIDYADDRYQAVKEADALVVVTEWKEFRRPDFAYIKELMTGAALFDGRNIWDAEEANELGFDYYAIGKGFFKANA